MLTALLLATPSNFLLNVLSKLLGRGKREETYLQHHPTMFQHAADYLLTAEEEAGNAREPLMQMLVKKALVNHQNLPFSRNPKGGRQSFAMKNMPNLRKVFLVFSGWISSQELMRGFDNSKHLTASACSTAKRPFSFKDCVTYFRLGG